jgi:hypothetical protein
LQALVIDYWHDVDTNWGRNAPDYYTEDGVFVGPAASYAGREKIRAFYKWREDRGARTVVHSVINFQAWLDVPGKATAHWFLMLYAADGKPVLPTHPPIQIAYMTDRLVRAATAAGSDLPQVRDVVRRRHADDQPEPRRQMTPPARTPRSRSRGRC